MELLNKIIQAYPIGVVVVLGIALNVAILTAAIATGSGKHM